MTPHQAAQLIGSLSPAAIMRLNSYTRESLQTRGGRAGSGLGSLLEALWGFMINVEFKEAPGGNALDLVWFPDHAYNDFALVHADKAWDPTTKAGELLRVEAKSMYRSADESKGHFNALQKELDDNDLLVVLIWDWVPVASSSPHARVSPAVLSSFVGPAKGIAEFRDQLHIARGGSFVDAPCPDGCPKGCKHLGEPLNAGGRRERRTGPESLKPKSASYAANYGGLVRMLKTNSEDARAIFRRARRRSDTVHRFVSFMHAAFPEEEANQYLATDWRTCGESLKIPNASTMSRSDLIAAVRSQNDYMDTIRQVLGGQE